MILCRIRWNLKRTLIRVSIVTFLFALYVVNYHRKFNNFRTTCDETSHHFHYEVDISKLSSLNYVNSGDINDEVTNKENAINTLPEFNVFKKDVFVYSAFKVDSQVIVNGILDRNYKYGDKVFRAKCEFEGYEILSKAKLHYLIEYSSYQYLSVFIKCDLPSRKDIQINRVRLVDYDDHRTEYIFINNQQITSNNLSFSKNKFGVGRKVKPDVIICIRPLFGPYRDVPALMQFLAYCFANKISRVVFYEYSFIPEVDRLLKSFSFVTIMSFNLPIKGESIHGHGQTVGMHDCLYRYPDDILIFIDIDEFLMPLKHSTIYEFVQDKYQNQINTADLLVKNVFFCNEFNSNREATDVFQSSTSSSTRHLKSTSDFYTEQNIEIIKNEKIANSDLPTIFRFMKRQRTPFPAPFRTKLIVLRPRLIHDLGVHSVERKNSWLALDLTCDVNEMLIYHYRSCCRKSVGDHFMGLFEFEVMNDYVVEDLNMYRFKYEIMNFMNKFKKL